MNNTIRELLDRKSVRVFEAREIEDNLKELIIQCAIEGPTAGNQMLYSIINITDEKIKEDLARTCDNQNFIKEAPFVLVFVADTKRWYESYVHAGIKARKPRAGDILLAIEDAMIAAQNAVTAAWSLGIGSCYIGDILENREEVMEILNLDEYVIPISMLVFGYPTKHQLERKKPRRFNRDYIVFENQYRDLRKDEHISMFMERNEDKEFDYDDYMVKFYNRKYASDFSIEMSRSSKDYLKFFLKE